MARGSRLLIAAAGLLVGLGTLAGCAIPRWPVEAPMTSPFGIRWRGVLPEIHRGVDIRVPVGTPVRAMAPGTVRFAGIMSGFGQVVWLDHGAAVMSVYAHLSEIRVREGQVLDGHPVIGLSGDSGNAEAPLLHFEIWRWGREQDPVPLLGGPPSG
ncbi:MAG: M23 family metallopeptidase [Longimicrobiales bacterium]|nr:M23 family metallopeptidase [Longimicrobiales bacterium]